MANSKRHRKVVVFSCIGLVLVALTLVAVFRKREPVIAVQTEKVARRDIIIETVTANGRIQPVKQVKISAEVSGEIIKLPVIEGQVVNKGDLLAKIKPDAYIANQKSAEAGYLSAASYRAQAEANMRKAELEFNRNEDLFKNKLISDSMFLEFRTGLDIAKANLESAQHQVEVAKASLARAEEDVTKTTLVSPLDGTVSKLSLQLGERVAGNTMMAGTEIMTVADLNDMEARVDIGENDIVLVRVGQEATLEVDAFHDRKFKGRVTDIANSSGGIGSSASSGGTQDATKFQVKIRIDEKENFRPGMSVSAEVQTRSCTNALAVPVQSVTTRPPKPKETASAGKNPAKGTNQPAADPPANSPPAATNAAKETDKTGKKSGEAPKQIDVVFVVDGEHVKMTPVKRGINDDAYAEITEGLSEGQEIVSGGYKVISRELEDGKKIRKEKPGAKKDTKEGEKK